MRHSASISRSSSSTTEAWTAPTPRRSRLCAFGPTWCASCAAGETRARATRSSAARRIRRATTSRFSTPTWICTPSSWRTFLRSCFARNADVVIGSKFHPESRVEYPRLRRIYSFFYYMLVRTLFGLPVRDTQTGIKLFKREVLERVLPRVLVKRFAFDLELLANAHHFGYRIVEAPVEVNFTPRLQPASATGRLECLSRHVGDLLPHANLTLLRPPGALLTEDRSRRFARNRRPHSLSESRPGWPEIPRWCCCYQGLATRWPRARFFAA